MAKYDWPISMIEGYGVSDVTMQFLDTYVKNSDKKAADLEELYKKHELLKDTSAKQERYIAELEKQLSLLQKTLDLIDKNGGGRVWQMLSGSR